MVQRDEIHTHTHTHAHFWIIWSLQKTMVACCISRIMTRRNKWVSCYFYGFMICMPALIAGVCVPGHLLLVINYSPKDTCLLWHHSDFPLKCINMLGPFHGMHWPWRTKSGKNIKANIIVVCCIAQL